MDVGGERADVLEGLAQVAEQQPLDGLVGDAEARRALDRRADAEQPETVQQGQEVLALGQPLRREAVPDVEHGEPQRLAEAQRADEEHEALVLQGADEAGPSAWPDRGGAHGRRGRRPDWNQVIRLTKS